MEYFQFNSNFLIGLKDVDDQHRRLVELINAFSDSLSSTEDDADGLERLFQELLEYTQYHFEEEETLMQEINVDTRHYTPHVEEHQNFLNDVMSMHTKRASDKKQMSKQLLSFLIHWLAYHILGSDKNMARQIEAIQSGASPSKAFEMMEKMCDGSTEPLLFAINGLFQLVSARNKELKTLNQSLEQKVRERTRELYEANKNLVKISLTDVLTELPNRRHAMQQLRKHWEESTKTDEPISLMMVDADHFKEVNDTYGHDAGDLVLCEVAKMLQDNVRTDDLVCRLGGDEFLIICPVTDRPGSLHIAEKVRSNISEMHVPTGNGFWRGSVSIGVASRKNSMDNFEALIKAADEGVYIAKRAGKNCVKALDPDNQH
ncbi:MAG: bacteriohemerythrin [Desulfobacula sp.]|jgi:diguanylate cyclase (GGDEF)-like protein/hemerythrin-like metal-binding protein|nr:bacteriohemerythrin [Desulfobacula sp.]MBT6341537.1 bacteriohemerythrin [Desulfobacula sp.]